MSLFPPVYALRVDWLPQAALPLPGRLGLTRAPGRMAPGRSFDSDHRLAEDLEDLARLHRARLLVTLVERRELSQLGDVRGAARRAGLRWVHLPIPDMWVPSRSAARRLVARILRSLEEGEDVVVHCWGGLGRAGTIAACVLVARGEEPRRAVALVRATRPGAVQTEAQEVFVEEFAGSCEP